MFKRLLVIVILATAIWVPAYLQRALWEPDEARYAYVAREMHANGCWFVPYRHGDLYAHKPPLMFWLINAGSLFTHGEIGRFATRFPSLLGLIMVLWSVGSITELWTNRKQSWWSVLITATTLCVWWRASWGQIDMLLCGLQMVGLYLLFAYDDRRSWWRPLLAYCSFGLAVLAKGPVGFIVPVGAYITANMAAGSGRNLLRWHWLWGLPVVLLWPCAWLLAARLSGAPDVYFDELLFSQNIERAAGGLGHIRPLYYYLEYLPVDGLPWIIMVPFCVFALIKYKPEKRQVLRRGLGWAVFVVLFFSLIPTKRSLYILMAYPALAILVAAGWPYLAQLSLSAKRIIISLCAIVPLLLAVALIAAPHIIKEVPFSFISTGISAALLLAGAVSLWTVYLQKGVSNRYMAQVVVVFLGLYLLTAHLLLPQLNPMKTPEALIPVVHERVPEGHPLLLYQINAEILPYYCDRPGLVFWTDEDFWRRGLRREKRGVAVFLDSVWEQKKHEFGQLGETGTFTMGHKELVWLAFDIAKTKTP